MYKSIAEGKGGITAKVVADSVANDVRLTTLELRYPRFIHSELMTHRMFSRNASSSRAIPVAKMIEQVQNDPAMPIHWGKNKPGMQADEEVDVTEQARDMWVGHSELSWECAVSMEALGVHKQVVNRILEPFQFISVVVTATEWDNFFKLRDHEAAQPEIQELAKMMKQAMAESVPISLEIWQYHLPYVDSSEFVHEHSGGSHIDWNTAIKASVARCARVSYLNHDKSDPDIEKDIALHDMLKEAGHMSPFEHIATPMDSYEMEYIGELVEWSAGITHIGRDESCWSGNFKSWIQYRQLL